jgi:peptidoglycan/xylan/chitin deacetylase (PgdA/CDA1 family)
MYPVKLPAFFRLFDRKYLISSFPPGEKKIYLTFDDGPVPEVTPEVLSILEEKNAKATFFCVGENVRKHPGIFGKIVEDGHSTGNHTFSHLNGWKTPPAFYADNVNRCREYFDTDLFRPPHGRFTPSQYFLLRQDYVFIMWTVLSGDFHRGTSAEKCIRQVIENAGDGSVIVFHDSIKAKEKVLKALPAVIDHFSGLGYSFERIPQMRPSSAKL